MRTSDLHQKVSTLLIAASSLLASTVFGALPDISINFTGCCNNDGDPLYSTPTPLLSSDVAGVVPRGNWNNLSGNNNHDVALNDTAGAATTVTIYYDADESWGSNAGKNTPDQKLLNGYLGISNDGHYRPLFLNNVPNGAYKLIMYNGRGDNQPQGYTVNPASMNTHLSIMPQGWNAGTWDGVWIRGTSTDPNARDVCNYVQFDEIAPINGTITIDCHSESFRGMMNGIQLIPLPAGAFRFVNQPADVNVDEGGSASFVGSTVDGTGAVTYKWLTNGVVDTSNLTPTYSRPVLNLNENGRTFALVGTDSTSQSVTSRVATLTVNSVTKLVSAASNGRTNRVFASFGAAIALTGTYTLNNGATVFSVAYGATHKDVVLSTSILIDNATYTLTATGETREDNGDPTSPNPTTITFVNGYGRFCSDFTSLPPAAALFNNAVTGSGYLGDDGTGNSVVHLCDDGNNGAYGKLYISNLVLGANLNVLDAHWRVRIGGDLGGHADGMTFSWANNLAPDGVFVAVEEGEGTGVSFVIDTWDGGSGPDTGIDIKWQGTQLPGSFLHIPRTSEGNTNFLCQDAFVSASASVSPAGLAKFTYNGNTVSAMIPGWTGIANGTYAFAARTGGENDNFWVDDVCINSFTLGPVFFTLQPVETTVLDGATATFTAAVDGSPSYSYQWFTNGVPITGANNPTYTTPPVTEAYQGLLYSVQASNDFSSVTSSNAVLHVNTSPRVVSVGSIGDNKVRIVYTRNVELGPDFGPPYYDFNNGVFEGSRAYGASHSEVIITTDSSLTVNTTYILTITDVTSEGDPSSVLLPNPTDAAFHHGYGSVPCADFAAGLPPGAAVNGSATVAGGFVHITDAANSLQGNFFVPDPNGGFPVDRLLVKFKMQIGPGTCCGVARWADGVSFNLGSDITAASNFSEEGGGNGLTVTFDTWDNAAPDTAPAIEVRYHGTVAGVQAMSGEREVGHAPPGPFLFDSHGNPLALDTSNTFANVQISIAPDGKLDLYFKDQIIFQNLQLPGYTPFVGANFLWSARTGGANENAWIDDLCINAFTLGAPTITQEPVDQTIFEIPPPRFAFNVGVDGLPPYSVQWYSNGVPIAGATALNYITAPLLRAASGSGYQAIISNDSGSVTSRTAIATIELNNPTKQLAVSFEGRSDDCAPACATLAPATTAGVAVQANWNNIDNSVVFDGVSGLLNDSNGAPTTVTLTYDAQDSWENDSATVVTGDDQMMKGISKAAQAHPTNTYTFNDVRPGFLYDVIVYINVNGDGRIGDISCGGQTYYFTSQHTFGGTFLQITNTIPSGARDTGNFVRFLSVAPNAQGKIVVQLVNRGDLDGVGVAGFQVSPASTQSQLAVSFTGRNDQLDAGYPLAPTAIAGVSAQANWNNIANGVVFGGVSGALNDSNGTPTLVTLTYDANDSWNNDGGTGTDNEVMMKGISKANGANHLNNYTFNNVRPGFYDVLVYLNVNGDGRIGDIACNGTTYYFTSQHSFAGSFIQITNSTAGALRDTGNYVRFNNVPANGANQILLTLVNRGDPDGVGIAGFQLLPGTPVTQLAASFVGRGDCAPACATLDPTTVAGLLPQGNWNNITNQDVFNGVTPPLVGSNGVATSATLTYDANDSWNNDQSPVVSGDEQMMKGISKANGTDRLNTYTFSDVRPGLYDVIVYLNVNGDNRIGDFSCNGVTYYITSQHQFGGAFIRGQNTSPGGTRDLCNYVRFFGVGTGPAGRISVTMVNRGDPDGTGIAGFQLVPSTGPVLISAATLGNPNGVRLGFTLPMGASALNPANYTLTFAGSQASQLSAADSIIGVGALAGDSVSSISTVGTAGGVNNFPAAESPTNILDGNAATKYLNFAKVNAGAIITRAAGAVAVTGFSFSTANDAPERDPSTVTIEGTTAANPTAAAGGATWTTIYSGPSGLATDPGRMTAGPVVPVAGAAAFNTYRILVTDVRNAGTANSFQFGDVQLYAGAPGGSIAISGAAYVGTSSNLIQLTTATPLTLGGTYTVTVGNVQDLLGVTIAPNPSSRTFVHGAEFTAAAGLTVKRFDGSGDINVLVGNIAACVTPARFSTAIAKMEYQTSENVNFIDGNTFGDANTENYGVWIYGQFVAPTTGNYVFGLANDDFARLYLSTDSDPAHKVLLIEKPAWGGFRDFVLPANGNTVAPLTAPIHLVAGRTYYMEALNAEGGGGDTLSVAVQLPGGPAIVDGPANVIPRSMFATNFSIGCPPSFFFKTLGPITITEQPANQNVVELFNAAFYVGLDGTPAYTVQWYSNSVAVPGATSQAYNPQVNRFANGSQWYAIAANDFSSVTSAVVTLTVVSDTIAPVPLTASGSDSFTNATIVFNEPVAVASATTLGNYSITNSAGAPLAIFGVLLRDNTNVVLHTAPQTQGERYTIIINNVTDRAGIPNPVAANTTVSFHGWVLSPGFALMETYNAGGGTTINLLQNSPVYPYYPRERFYMTTPNSRNAYPDDSHDNYGGRISGLVIPPASGNYQFSINNDDDALLRGALTDNPGDLQDLGAQVCCSGTFRNTGPTLPLTGGNRYAYQLLWKEGGGGDYAALSADGVNPIPADYLAVYANPDAVSLVFTTDLAPNYNRVVNQLPTLTVAAQVTSFDGAVRPLLYQWYSNDVAIAGATGPSYTTAIMTLANEGDVYKVLARTPGATLLSIQSTQHVSIDDIPPVLVSVTTDATFTKIFLNWNEIMNEGTAIEPSSYLILDPQMNQIFVDTVDFDPASGSNVVLNLTSPMAEATVYSVEIDFQQDLAANGPAPIGNPEIDTEHGVKTTVSSWVNSPCGGIEFSLFNNLSTADNNIATTLLADPRFPNNPTSVDHIPGMSSRLIYPDDTHEGYGARLRGLFIPPTSGNWVFYIRSDDSSRLYFNPSGPNAAGKVIIQEETGCCNAFSVHPSAPQTLVAGQGYYIEMLYKEGTGGDYGLVGAKLQGQPAPAVDTDTIPAGQLGYPAAPGGIGGVLNITLQPVDTATTENTTVTFTSTFVSPNDLPICYQWRRDGSDIPGANSRTYTTPLLTLADNNAVFSVQASIIGAKTTSTNATLHVFVDVTPPLALKARGVRLMNAINVTFNEPMSSGSATEVSNYTITDSNGAPVTATGTPVLSGDGTTVTIPTPVLNEGALYHVAISGVTDLAGNPIVNTNLDFRTWVVGLGSLLFEAYNTGGGNDVSILTSHPSYPNSPDYTQHIDAGDSRRAYPTDAREAYGARLSGYFVPQLTTNYTFYLRSDDASELWLSTDSSPANKVLLTADTACCGAFSAHGSSSISLVAGQSYYMELLYKEGVGGDYGQVAVKRTSSPQDPNTLLPINGALLSSLADPNGAFITVTQQPLSQLFPVAATPVALLSENFNSGNGGFTVSTPLAYDNPWTYDSGTGSWIENGQDVDNGHANISKLASPAVTLSAAGHVIVSFSHRYSFEFDGTAWDGGQLRVSINGGPTNAVAGGAFTQNGYTGSAVAIGAPSFISASPGHGGGTKITSTADLGFYPAGTTIRIEFYAANDSNTRGAVPNWQVDSVDIVQGSSPLNVTLSAGFTATNEYGDFNQVAYQWQRNVAGVWKDILGQNGPTFVTVPPPGLVTDYRVKVYIPGASATSATATVVGLLSVPWVGPGTLQWADQVTGPWTNVPSPTNPYIYDTRLGPMKFFRVLAGP